MKSEELVGNMFEKIIRAPDAFFRSQQKDEPNLEDNDKLSICSSLYHEHPVQFLARYHQFLDSSDIACFDHLAGDQSISDDSRYELDHYLSELASRNPIQSISDQRNSVARNRRYAAMKRLVANGEYFSDYEMRHRHPLLYDQMIGQHQTEEEQRLAFHDDEQPAALSSVLLDLYDAKELSKRRREELVRQHVPKRRRRSNEGSIEEEETDDQIEAEDRPRAPAITDEEKRGLREEFIREMQERFLDGKDAEFDYRTVDENPEYDLLDMQAKDDEDKYFDEEEPDNP